MVNVPVHQSCEANPELSAIQEQRKYVLEQSLGMNSELAAAFTGPLMCHMYPICV